MYICYYKCKYCNKIIRGKIINQDKISEDKIISIKENYNIPNQILHNTIGHLGVADFIGLEDYDAYQLSLIADKDLLDIKGS